MVGPSNQPSLTSQYSTIQQPENSETNLHHTNSDSTSLHKFRNNSDSTTIQSQIQISTEIQPKINKTTPNSNQKQEEDADLQFNNSENQEIKNLDLQQDEVQQFSDTSSGVATPTEADDNMDEKLSTSNNGGVDLSSNSDAEVGACAMGEEEETASDGGASAFVTNADYNEEGEEKAAKRATSLDLNDGGDRRRISLIVARPQALLAAIFPWDREIQFVTVKKRDEVVMGVNLAIDDAIVGGTHDSHFDPRCLTIEEGGRKQQSQAVERCLSVNELPCGSGDAVEDGWPWKIARKVEASVSSSNNAHYGKKDANDALAARTHSKLNGSIAQMGQTLSKAAMRTSCIVLLIFQSKKIFRESGPAIEFGQLMGQVNIKQWDPGIIFLSLGCRKKIK